MTHNTGEHNLNEPLEQGTLSVLLLTKQSFAEPRDGGTMRTSSVHKELVQRGLHVTTVAVESNDTVTDVHRVASVFSNLGPKVRVLSNYVRAGSVSSARWFRPSTVDRIVHELAASTFDCVVVEYTQLMSYASLFNSPVVLDMHNIESELLFNYAKSSKSVLRKMIAIYEGRRVAGLEHRLPSIVQLLSAVSPRDVEIAKSWSKASRNGTAKVVLAANGVSDGGFALEGKRNNDVVFVAHLGWQPNVDAAKWLVREVWPLVTSVNPNLQLRLIGRAPSPEVLALAGPRVLVEGDVPSVVEYVAAARVATAPLLAAGGTRLKILEALSCGTPVVATSLGALGLESLAGPSLAIADSAPAFASEILRLAATDISRSLSRDLVDAYRWPTTLKELGDEVEQLASRHKNLSLSTALTVTGTKRSESS
ncbi:glycosyltransferase [Pseudarthrobacter sp. NPDC057230]|uniref:glycosyltransferase n=1 Tax=Pseudarthrobacter sp. NPDC057230 TaxID=3346057 RepID=UPI003641E3B7